MMTTKLFFSVRFLEYIFSVHNTNKKYSGIVLI